MIRKRSGEVISVGVNKSGMEIIKVAFEGRTVSAINYVFLTGRAFPGDLVLLNNTALHLGLGTGGFDFVYHNFSTSDMHFHGKGHIMKLRYTPWQLRVLCCEEEEAGFQDRLAGFQSLNKMPVLVGELHSHLIPVVAVVKYYYPACRVAYLMSDGGALPAAFSRILAELKERALLAGTISCGHAFGGDLEAVNIYSALVAAKEILKADLAIITMGPGHVGTGTRFGFSGMEVGEHINRVNALGGLALVIPRISFADIRPRHFGISHHTLTALMIAACSPALLVLPRAGRSQMRLILRQLARQGIWRRHRILIRTAPPLNQALKHLSLGPVESMGRSFNDDPIFFNAAAAAAAAALELLAVKPFCRKEVAVTANRKRAEKS